MRKKIHSHCNVSLSVCMGPTLHEVTGLKNRLPTLRSMCASKHTFSQCLMPPPTHCLIKLNIMWTIMQYHLVQRGILTLAQREIDFPHGFRRLGSQTPSCTGVYVWKHQRQRLSYGKLVIAVTIQLLDDLLNVSLSGKSLFIPSLSYFCLEIMPPSPWRFAFMLLKCLLFPSQHLLLRGSMTRNKSSVVKAWACVCKKKKNSHIFKDNDMWLRY